MSLPEIVALGIIQGLTEFFPVSSSGHLVIFQVLFGLREPQVFVDAMLHVGTLLSLIVFLRKELSALFRSFVSFLVSPRRNISDPNTRLILWLFLATVPTVLIGYLFSGFFESLFGSMRAVGASLIVTAAFLLLTKFSRERKTGSFLHPLLIGLLQGAAIIPGLSRSGLTIGGALLLGWKRKEAVSFSFLLSIPAILGASLYELQKAAPTSQSWLLLLAGILTSAVFGYLALASLASLVKRGKFYFFAYYCLPIGLLALALSFVI